MRRRCSHAPAEAGGGARECRGAEVEGCRRAEVQRCRRCGRAPRPSRWRRARRRRLSPPWSRSARGACSPRPPAPGARPPARRCACPRGLGSSSAGSATRGLPAAVRSARRRSGRRAAASSAASTAAPRSPADLALPSAAARLQRCGGALQREGRKRRNAQAARCGGRGRRRTLERLVGGAWEEDPLHVCEQVQRLLLLGGLGVVVELWRRVRRAGAAFRMRAARRCRRVAARRCQRVRGAPARRRPEGARRLRRSPAIGGLRANLAGSWRPRAEGCDPRAAGERGPARLRRACGRRAVAPLEWGLSEAPRPGMQILEEALRQGLDGLGPRALHVGHPWLALRLILSVLLLRRPLSSRALGCNQAFLLQHDVLRPR